ncbi:MAG TPA: hypothetical protein VKU01_31665 [Bryobacteraceae bacterium]|nr:hypothetical protein [Bryobacteraceae bacterium]
MLLQHKVAQAISPALFFLAVLNAQDAREIIRKSVELDQLNWLQMKHYTWTAFQTEKSLDSQGAVKSEKTEKWETVVLYGRPFRRMLERDGKPLTAEQQAAEQKKLDEKTAKLERETPDERASRVAKEDKEREKDREFLREIPDMFDFKIEREDQVDGHPVWVIAATPKSDYKPKHSDAKPLLKIKGTIWIDKAELQWVRLDAETIDTISFGLFLARLSTGSTLHFEQMRVNDEVWLPKYEMVHGSARLGLVKKFSMEQTLTWSGYKKFQVDSKIVPADTQ